MLVAELSQAGIVNITIIIIFFNGVFQVYLNFMSGICVDINFKNLIYFLCRKTGTRI